MSNFVDETSLIIQAGRGGDGSASFRREKYIPYGGPDGGDGGKGGDVVFVVDLGLNTLVDFQHVREIKAKNGEAGRGQQCAGRSGDDVIVRVPRGTVIYDRQTGLKIIDLTEPNQRAVVAAGGEGGLGNTHFKSSTNRAPRQFTKGKPGERLHIQLELRVLADVGLVGLPNAGKSTLIRSVSAAKPKVANYPFTTLKPHLGVVRLGEGQSYVIADIPGLISGASEGVGLGHQFLRHVSRTKLLLHLVDVMPMDGSDPVENAKIIAKELEAYELSLAEKPRWLVLNKIDTIEASERDAWVENFREALGWEGPLFAVSAAQRTGTDTLCAAIGEGLRLL